MVDTKQNDTLLAQRKALAGELFEAKVHLQGLEIAVVHGLAVVEDARSRPVPLLADAEYLRMVSAEVRRQVEILATSLDRTADSYLALLPASLADKD
jgi:hypothetical protein